jgi:2-C-methyl-D-erythritol 4-phosphate cytidylyltransferase
MYAGKKVGVVLAAAGGGLRFGGSIPKQFLEIAGTPIWMHALLPFSRNEWVDVLAVVVVRDVIDVVEDQVSLLRPEKVLRAVAGGALRQDSVRNGLEMLKEHRCDIALVHDAARPCVRMEMINSVLKAAVEFGAAIPAVKAQDTAKTVDEEMFSSSTVDRRNIWLVQTPQGFEAALLSKAFDRAAADGFVGTDESSLVERLGVRVKIVLGRTDNIKVTTPEDFRLAEILLRN